MAEKDNLSTKLAGLDKDTLVGLKDIIAAIVAEANKPNAIELAEHEERLKERAARLDKEAQEQLARKQTAEDQLSALEGRRSYQLAHAHYNNKRSQVVFVHDPLGGYVICQGCQITVRPELQRRVFPANYNGLAVLDNELYTRL